MVARMTCSHMVANSSLAFVTFVFFFWQGRLVHMPMNTASRGLSVHSKMPYLSGCVSTANALSTVIDLLFLWVFAVENTRLSRSGSH